MPSRKPTKPSAAVQRGVDALAELLRDTRGRRGRRDLILNDQMRQLGEDELIVLVVGKHNAVARSVRRPDGQIDLRDLQLSAEGAALAVEELGPRKPLPAADLSEQEQTLLGEGGFEVASPGAKLASDDGALEYLAMLRDSLSPEDAAELLEVNASRVRQRLGERRLYGVKDGRAWKLPRFQFTDDRLVPGIDRVLPALPHGMHPVAVHRWFRSPHVDLELDDGTTLTPLEWLERGHDPTQVTDLAAML